MTKILQKIWTKCWTIGIIEGGISSIMKSDALDVKWLKLPKERWFADPFVLDVVGNEVHLLVEDFEYVKEKASISLLKIDKQTLNIISRKIVLELPTHLSFPYILRENGRIFVCPENCQGEGLVMYEFDKTNERLLPCKKICGDVVWDSVLTYCFGEPLLFTANKDDYHLDIYKKTGDNFSFFKTIVSNNKDSRMAGDIFEYEGNYYYPAQDCSNGYGETVVIKEVFYENDDVIIGKIIKRFCSTNKRMPLGFHTLNEYKGIAVVDACGWRYKNIVSCILWVSRIKNYCRKICRK